MAFFFDAPRPTQSMEEEARALLRPMLLASALVSTATAILGVMASGRTEHLLPTAVMVIFQMTCWRLVQHFKTKSVAVAYLLVVTVLTVPISLLDRGVEGQAYYSLVLVQIIAALLFELRTALLFSLLAILGGLPLILVAQRHGLPVMPQRDPVTSWLVPASAFLLVTIALSAVHRRLRHAVTVAHESAERASRANEALKQENERRQAAEAKALSGLHSKSAFLANVSHDLRTPMNAVVGLTDLLLRDELAPEHREHLETIRSSSEGLLRLLNDILDMSKIEAGSMTFERLPVKVRELVDGVRRLFQESARAKGLAFEVTVAPEVPEALEVDPTRLKQVLVNLLGNAIKFTERGRVTVSCLWAADQLSMVFTDTGVGISAQNRELLFQPFSQGDASTTRKFGGTGLGLVIVGRLCHLMGGTVKVESQVGIGSTFTASIAAKATDSPVAAQMSDRAELPRIDPSVRILLAEDNPVNQKVALRLLERLGLKADVAENGRVAYEHAQRGDYDIILMDLQMPGTDGIQATRSIREFESENAMNPVYIIALTAEAMSGDRIRCMEAGMDDYLAKPIKSAELTQALERFSNSPPRTHHDHTRH